MHILTVGNVDSFLILNHYTYQNTLISIFISWIFLHINKEFKSWPPFQVELRTQTSVAENNLEDFGKLEETECCDYMLSRLGLLLNGARLNVHIFQWHGTRACIERHNNSLLGPLTLVTCKVWHLSHPNCVQLLPKPRLGRSSLGGDWWHSLAGGVGWRRLVCAGAQTPGGMIWNSHTQDYGDREVGKLWRILYVRAHLHKFYPFTKILPLRKKRSQHEEGGHFCNTQNPALKYMNKMNTSWMSS